MGYIIYEMEYVIFIIFGIGFSYNKLEEIKVDFKKDWPDNRCNPFYMPFAKMANADPAGNFADCKYRNFNIANWSFLFDF